MRIIKYAIKILILKYKANIIIFANNLEYMSEVKDQKQVDTKNVVTKIQPEPTTQAQCQSQLTTACSQQPSQSQRQESKTEPLPQPQAQKPQLQSVPQLITQTQAKSQKKQQQKPEQPVLPEQKKKQQQKLSQPVIPKQPKIQQKKTEQPVFPETTTNRLTIQSKKIQINNLDHQLVLKFIQEIKDKVSTTKTICIQGNSYSLDFCRNFAEKYLANASSLQSLDINDIFVARSKQEIPASIQSIAKALSNTQLKNLDISHNAVNPYGAKALLNFLNTAKSLEVFLISNCGLGPLGVAEIAKGLQGTPNLRVFSIGRNRMQNAGIISLAESMKYVPKLEQLFIYQNTLRKQGLSKLFLQLRSNCKNLHSFDLCDNFVREEATEELLKLICENLQLKNLNLSDCLNQGQNQKVVQAFQTTKNRGFTKLGFNYIELQEDLALRLLEVLKQCPIQRLDVLGNDFPKKIKKAYSEAFPQSGVLSRFEQDQDEQQEIIRLFEEMKI